MANSKQEVANTFEKGMIKDLNPINTPNDVLTDCLNGTIITYDGNEYQLQNDRGNISLEYSKLPKGFIPVGTTSYGDILYIVAYNPINGHTQIGSFPSPRRQFTNDGKFNKENKSIITKALANHDNPIDYEYAIENYQELLVANDGTNSLEIFPGDEYNIDPDTSEYKYEELQYFIITDEKKLIEITDQIEVDGKNHYVKWEVPGYLATKWRLPIITEFNIKPSYVNKTNFTIGANYQILSEDPLLAEAVAKDHCDLQVKVKGVSQPVPINEIDKYATLSYYNGKNESASEESFDLENNAVTIEATPILKIRKHTGEAVDNYIEYSQFKQMLTISLTDLFSKETTHIAEDGFVYSVDKNFVTMKFNIEANVVTTGAISLDIYAVKLAEYIKMSASDKNDINKWKDIGGGNLYDGLGQQIIELPFEEEENIYVIKIALTDGLSDPIVKHKLVICSEMMNQFTEEMYSDFELIPFNVWLPKVAGITSSVKFEMYDSSQADRYTYDDKSSYWSVTQGSINLCTGFVAEGDPELEKRDYFRRGYFYNVRGNIKGSLIQKYLYNFCKINFANNTLSITDSADTIDVNSPIDKMVSVKIPAYVEDTYEVSGAIAAEACPGLQFKMHKPWDKKHVFFVNLLKDNGLNSKFEYSSRVYSIGNLGSTNVSLYNEELIRKEFTVKNVSKSSPYIKLETSPYTIDAKKVLSKYEMSAIPTVIRVGQEGGAKTVFVSTDHFGSFTGCFNGKDDGYIIGITFNGRGGCVFIPITALPNTAADQYKINGIKNSDTASYSKPTLKSIKYADIFEVVYDILMTLRTISNKQFLTPGYFIQKARLSQELHNDILIRLLGKVDVLSIQVLGVNQDILSDQFLLSVSEFNNFSTTLTLNYSNLSFDVDDILCEGGTIPVIFNKSEWPYKDAGGLKGLDSIANLNELINAIIQEQYRNWLSSDLYQRLGNGQSIGYYNINDLNTKLSQFVSRYLNYEITDNEYDLYNKPSEVMVKSDILEVYWGISVGSNSMSEAIDEAFDFEDVSDLKRHPRYRLFKGDASVNLSDYTNQENFNYEEF